MNIDRSKILEIGDKIRDGLLSQDEGFEALNILAREQGVSSVRFQKEVRQVLKREKSTILKRHTAKIASLTNEAEQAQLELEELKTATDLYTSEASPSFLLGRFRQMYPQVWDEVAQRVYKNVDSYGDYRLAYLEWGWAKLVDGLISEESKGGGPGLKESLDSFQSHKAHGFPFFFVSQGISEAAWQSDLKFAVEWKTMHLPFESFTFVLPKTNPLDHDAVIVQRLTRDGEPALKLIMLGKKMIGNEFLIPHPFEASQGEESDAARFVFNTIYAMSARPEYVEQGERVGHKKKSQSEIWTPNIIGRKYAVKSHTFADRQGNTRLHWRRGHFRQQVFGIGRTQRKTIWIEPMMVGGKAEKQA